MVHAEAPLASETLRDRWLEFEDQGSQAGSLAGALTGEQLWWRPAPGRWSVGECLEHLVLAGEAYLEVLDESIAKARRRGWTADGPPGRGLLGNLLVHGVEPPARVKIPAPARIRPERPATPHDDGGEGPLARFLALRGRYRERLEDADGLDLGRAKVRSPFVPLVRLSLDAALRVVTGHERRHLHQARRVLAAPDFPARR